MLLIVWCHILLPDFHESRYQWGSVWSEEMYVHSYGICRTMWVCVCVCSAELRYTCFCRNACVWTEHMCVHMFLRYCICRIMWVSVCVCMYDLKVKGICLSSSTNALTSAALPLSFGKCLFGWEGSVNMLSWIFVNRSRQRIRNWNKGANMIHGMLWNPLNHAGVSIDIHTIPYSTNSLANELQMFSIIQFIDSVTWARRNSIEFNSIWIHDVCIKNLNEN